MISISVAFCFMSHITLFGYYKKNATIHVYMLYTGYNPLPVKNISDQSFTVLVVKHNIQVSTEWFPESKIWNFIINKYIFTKDTGFNLPLIHFKISFKTHSTCHNIKNNSILNFALSTKISFHLCLTGLDIRFHYHVTTTV